MVEEDSKVGDVRTASDSAHYPLVGDVLQLSLHGRRVVRTIMAKYGKFLWVFESSTTCGVNECLRHTLTTEADWRHAIEADATATLLWGGERDIPF